MNKTLTALTGVRVGHSTHADKLTGCTAIIFDRSLPMAYRTYGGAPGTFNTDSLRSGMTDYGKRGIFIAGGSLTGLMSAAPIMQAMIEAENGDQDAGIINPAITGAIVFDLGTQLAKYDPGYGREAYAALSRDPVAAGNVGAGTGTSVGKFQYLEKGTKNAGMKAGIGNARVDLGNGIIVTALSVVNALGNVVLPDGTILAGNRDESKPFKDFSGTADFVTRKGANTTISVVGINVDLGAHENYDRLAHAATHGQVRAIHPVHTSIDGDTVFVFSTREIKRPLNDNGRFFQTPDWPNFTVDIISDAASTAVQESIYDACRKSESIVLDSAYQGIIPACHDYPSKGTR